MPNCYCEERKNNPAFAKGLEDMPEGYCGRCDIYGGPGHMCTHPNLPITGAWCDECWDDIVSGRSFGLHTLLWYIFVVLSTSTAAVYGIIKLVSWLYRQ